MPIATRRDRTALATADEEGEVRLWDAHSGQAIHTWVHPGPATSVAFAPVGKAVAAGYRHGAVRIWDTATGNARDPIADRTL